MLLEIVLWWQYEKEAAVWELTIQKRQSNYKTNVEKQRKA